MLSRSILGIAAPPLGRGILAEAQRPLEGAFHRKIEDRADQLIVLFEEQDRRPVAIAPVDGTLDEMPAVNEVVEAEADGHSIDVLVFDADADAPWHVERPV